MASVSPLDDTELDRLDRLLQRCSDPEDGAVGLEMLDGILSAVLAGPSVLAPEDYLPLVWGSSGAGRDARQTAEAEALIARLHAQIQARISTEPAALPGGRERAYPLLMLPEEVEAMLAAPDDASHALPDDFPYASAWAGGFLAAVHRFAEAWDPWLAKHPEIDNDLLVISRLCLVDASHAREIGHDEDAVLSFSERLDLAEDLPEILHDMYLQRLYDQRPAPARRPATPGRNDPCPCGSGRKYKKCHG